MSDESFSEDMERYRRNNVELAVALNDLKTEVNILHMQLLGKNRQLQKIHDENASLKQNLVQRDAQISVWQSLIVDLVTTSTRKYTEVMQNIGLVPSANASQATNAAKQIERSIHRPENQVIIQRPQRAYDDCERLPDLTEESIGSQLSDTKSFTTSPEKRMSYVTSRRRASIASSTPPTSPLRDICERLVVNGEIRSKSSAKVQKMEMIVDENTPVNTSSRPKRNTAPRNLSEPKLTTKMRRN